MPVLSVAPQIDHIPVRPECDGTHGAWQVLSGRGRLCPIKHRAVTSAAQPTGGHTNRIGTRRGCLSGSSWGGGGPCRYRTAGSTCCSLATAWVATGASPGTPEGTNYGSGRYRRQLGRSRSRRDLAPFATAFGTIPRLVWRHNVDAPIEPIKVRIFPNGGVGGSHFDRAADLDQLLTECVADLVDLTRKELAQAVALDYPGEGLQDSDAHVAPMIRD